MLSHAISSALPTRVLLPCRAAPTRTSALSRDRRVYGARRHRSSTFRSFAIFGFIENLKQGIMGNSSSSTTSAGWTPAPSSDAPRVTSRSGFDITPLTKEQKSEAAKQLDGMARYVALEHGTERAFTGKVGGTASLTHAHC